jgi:hypothetical protein
LSLSPDYGVCISAAVDSRTAICGIRETANQAMSSMAQTQITKSFVDGIQPNNYD